MTFTYNPVMGARKDKIRFLIGDVDESLAEDLRLHDEEIELALDLEGSMRLAAAQCADALAAKFSRKLEGASGGLSPSRTRAQELRATASRLRSLPAGSASSINLPANSYSDKLLGELDTDRVNQPFYKGMLDHDN